MLFTTFLLQPTDLLSALPKLPCRYPQSIQPMEVVAVALVMAEGVKSELSLLCQVLESVNLYL